MKTFLHNDWAELLADEFEQDYYRDLRTFLINEYRGGEIFPPMDEIYNALHWTSYQDTRVVILGQDPYHGPGQAHGLCFSVRPEVRIPPSLQNIYKELKEDLGCAIPSHGYLEKWARQGVLMLNAVLTVRSGQASSHQKMGWETLTDRIIRHVNEKPTPVVFILWGNHARSKKSLVTGKHHLVIESPHPSPLSAHRGFFGTRPFSRSNRFLSETGQSPIDWCIEEQHASL